MAAVPTSDTDGRRLRREQNRQAVVEALVGLYADGRFDASTAEIAERAGLSPRSLFRYFDDTDDLMRAAVAHHVERARPLLSIGVEPSAPTAAKVEALVRRRIGLWEAVGPSARIARMRAPIVPALAVELRTNRAAQRAQLARLFEPELDALDPAAARRLLAALDVVCSFESFTLLVDDHQLAADELIATLEAALLALLAPGGHRP